MEILFPKENPTILTMYTEGETYYKNHYGDLVSVPIRVSHLVPPDEIWIVDGFGVTVFQVQFPGKGYKIAYENALIEDWHEVWI